MSEEDPPAKRMRLGGDGLLELSKEELIAEHKKKESYIATLLNKLDGSACGSGGQSELEERLKQQHAEASRKEKVLLMQLTRKEQELQEIATQLGEITKGNTPGASQLRSALLDPALNILFQRMRHQLDEKSKKLQQATDDMAAWKFTPDSQTGKRLMSKCRALIQENQELGKQVSTGRTAQLEAELALQKKYSEELKASQDELNEFVIQLDEEVEGMQSTICALQQQLKEAKDDLAAFKAKQAEPRTAEPLIPKPQTPEPQVLQQVAQQKPEAEGRTSPVVDQVRAPESPPSEPGFCPTPSSPAPKSPSLGVAVGDRTPSEETDVAASAVGEGPNSENPHPRTTEVMEAHPAAEEGGSGGDDRTADEALVPRRDEEQRTTAKEEQGDEDIRRTTEMSNCEVRTFNSEDMEAQEQQQLGMKEEKTANQVTSQDVKEASQEECQQREQCQKWDWVQQQQQQEIQQQQQQQQQKHVQQQHRLEEAEEEMEVDPSRFENDSSSTESESFLMDVQQSKPVGELTSPVGSCEVPKTFPGDDSDEGFSTMTPDHGPAEPSTGPQDLDQTHDVTYESSSALKHSVEPLGNNDSNLGVGDSSSGQGTEGSPSEPHEVLSTSSNQDNAISSLQTDGVSNSTFESQVTHSKTVPEGQILNKPTQETLFSEVKVTAKKLPHNCSLSVVDYDTGSSDEDDDTANEDDGGFVEEPPRPSNKTLPPTSNHSPTNQLPEPPYQNQSPETSSPTSPANNANQTGSEDSPLKILSAQMLPDNGDSDTGLLTKSSEPRDLGFIEENGTESVHNSEVVTAGTE